MNSSPPPPTTTTHHHQPPIPTQIVIDDDLPAPSNNNTASASRRRPPPPSSPPQPLAITPPRNLPLVDEIDLRQCFTFDKLPSPASMQGMVIGKEELNVICGRATQSFDDVANHTYCSHHGGGGGNNNSHTIINVSPSQSPVRRGDYKACPCCRRYIENFDAPVSPGSVETSSTVEQLQQLQKSNNLSSDDTMNMEVDQGDIEAYGSWNLQRSMLTSTMGSSLMSLFNGGLDYDVEEEEFNMSAPPLVQGDKVQHYTITETIVQGWLYKKGSGNDIWGRRWWKPRWVTLAVSSWMYYRIALLDKLLLCLLVHVTSCVSCI